MACIGIALYAKDHHCYKGGKWGYLLDRLYGQFIFKYNQVKGVTLLQLIGMMKKFFDHEQKR